MGEGEGDLGGVLGGVALCAFQGTKQSVSFALRSEAVRSRSKRARSRGTLSGSGGGGEGECEGSDGGGVAS